LRQMEEMNNEISATEKAKVKDEQATERKKN
jgi:hypothetical protein